MKSMTTPRQGEPTAARSPRRPVVTSVVPRVGPGAVSVAPALLRSGVRRPGQPGRVGSTLDGDVLVGVGSAAATTNPVTGPSTAAGTVRTRLVAFAEPTAGGARPTGHPSSGHAYADSTATGWVAQTDLSLDHTFDQIDPLSLFRGTGGRTV